MSILQLYEYPHPILTQKAERVLKVDDDIRKLLKDMLETMYADKGVGLAAPQVGVSKRIIVIDTEQRDEDGNYKPGNPMYLINPEIIYKSEEMIWFCEGCLSVPKQSADVERHYKIKVRYLDYDGKEQEIEAEDYPAVVLQHEIDHLDGILYIDRISRLKRNMLLKKLEKYRQSQK
ncbi:MAG: peptide deformylase [Alphaproteobacteria bacterium]|nr:peptide deformylase [Alphaproteobacteria bacterium]